MSTRHAERRQRLVRPPIPTATPSLTNWPGLLGANLQSLNVTGTLLTLPAALRWSWLPGSKNGWMVRWCSPRCPPSCALPSFRHRSVSFLPLRLSYEVMIRPVCMLVEIRSSSSSRCILARSSYHAIEMESDDKSHSPSRARWHCLAESEDVRETASLECPPHRR